MKATLVPVYLTEPDDPELVAQLGQLRVLLADVADILPPVALGAPLPPADAVLFPQLTGEAYRHVAQIAGLSLPIVVLTSEFGTMAMWDWEIISYLRGEGIPCRHDERTVDIRPNIASFQIGIHARKWTRHFPHLHRFGRASLLLG